MNSIHHLREALFKVLSAPESVHGERELFDELMVQKPRLLKLFEVGPRNAQEQREIESGKPTINGKSTAVNEDFARQVVFLAQQLDCSEKYVAEILHFVTSENPNIGAVSAMELTMANFHQRRRHLVDSLRFLLEATEAAELPDAPPTYKRIAKFVREEILSRTRTAAGETSLANKIFKEIEQLDVGIAKAEAARKNAGSNTVAPTGQGNFALGFDILNARHDSLKYERRYLAIVLSSIARLGYISPNEIKPIIDWLSSHSNHPMSFYLLTVVFLAFDPIDPLNPISSAREVLATDVSLMTFLTKKFEPSTAWKDPGLKATVLLKWTMFITEARHNDATLEHRTGFKTEELETQVWNAVQGDAFNYLALSVVHLDNQNGTGPTASILENGTFDLQDQREVPPDDFKLVVLFALESLVRSLVMHASSELRKIKQRQEDLVLASARTDRNRTASRFVSTLSTEPEKSGPSPRHDIAMLYSFIGILYNALPEERALQFWGSGQQPSHRTTYQESVESTSGRLPSFLQWAVWSTPPQDLIMMAALYDMLSGLANGQQCSELAYNFLARGGGEVLPGSVLSVSSATGPSVSWTAIFGLLESWAISASNPRSQPQLQSLSSNQSMNHSFQNLAPPHPAPHQFVLGSKDVLHARSFLRVLSTVVKHSVAVRTTISGHAHFRAIPTLLSLIPLGIPLELKGAIFQTLAAFCEPGAGIPGVEICKAVWTLMERFEVINVRMGPSGMSLATGKGVEVELEQVESVHRLYPSTIPFLKLLAVLIHTPKQLSLHDRAAGTEPLNTIPENLGQPYRLLGIGPFISFVVDTVFTNIPNREYSRPSDRWQTNDLCLNFIERSLASFNLEALVDGPDDSALKQEALVPLLIHPGYDLMKRLLTNTPLQSSILSYIVEGLEGFEKGLADEEPFFRNTIIRVLRIVYRVLEIQDIFLDVFLPLLQDFNSSTFIGQVHSRSFFTRFDQALSFSPQYIPALAAYMAYPTHSELVLLSVKTISKLSLSTTPSTLVTLIERSQDSDRILGGFMQVLCSESMDDVEQAEAYAEQTTGAGAPDIDASSESLEQAIRLVALKLLIQDTETNRPYPNVAHFFLFGGKAGDRTIQDPHALGARQTSIHVLLDLVNTGVPRLRRQRKDKKEQVIQVDPLFITLPGLAERCYHVIHQLCIHPRTSDFVTRYLRTREDFFARQIAKVPSATPEALLEPLIQVLYNDGTRVTTTVPSLSSFLRLRSYIFDLVALELHILTNKGHYKAVSELLEIVFGTDFEYEEEHNFPTFHELGQSPIRIIDFLQSLMFDWADSLAIQPIEMQYLKQLNLQTCIRRDASGCEIVDRTVLLYLLSTAKRTLLGQGSIATPAQSDQLNAEMTYVLESCAIENHRRKVSHARVGNFEAWRRLLDLALTKCFDRLPHDRRENMLFDLLHVLPSAIRSSNIEESTAVLLSETILSSITKLREDRQHQMVLHSLGGDSESGTLPAERLYNILRNILEGILDSNHVELVRGNLYAALINLIHLVRSSPATKAMAEVETNPFAVSLTLSSLRDSVSRSRSPALPPNGEQLASPNSNLEVGCLAVMKPVLERLVTSISRDAIDGTEVWKTIAFMLLDAVVQLSSLEKQHVVLSALNRHGILSNFVRSIKDSDSRLQGVLKPDPDDLNSLYVYESKMSLFIRMAQTRAGAERLLEAQLLPILSQCDYLDARPEADQSFIDQDSFLPSAIQRYHQLFMPALQVVDGMLATLGSRHTTATHQALEFLSNHGPTIAILLKNESEYVTLPTLEEIHLIVTLCTNILPSVPKTEVLSPNSGFGAIHLAILGLSTKCLARGKAFAQIVPQTDFDVKLSNTRAFGFGAQSKFHVNVQRKERLLRKSVISYIGVSSEFTEPEITLVLSPITITPRHEERASHFATTVPTVGDALVALEDICSELSGMLKQISDIGAELANKDHIGLNNSQEVFREIDPGLMRDLEIEQKRVLFCEAMERIRTSAKQDARVLLDTLEMLLLLIWRHLEYYAEPRHMGMPPAKATITNAMRLLATAEPEVFRAEVAAKVQPTLQRLSTLEFDAQAFSREWQDSQGYIQIMCRRLKDSAGLHDETSSSMGGESE
ncbi:hypothetical protein GALMADRAFT_250802 [Galerina marginata CBS 339.88]|uniref:Uncharacterized protein n=1 Tax=Galerina marginata (strain CBS 339.88) TaxID=685588 RepID=A0A067T4X3_GALM3|nr:hypothetical protein GALMADRAFT_250802 [Galerina marginata CBS 339.88]